MCYINGASINKFRFTKDLVKMIMNNVQSFIKPLIRKSTLSMTYYRYLPKSLVGKFITFEYSVRIHYLLSH